MTWIQIMEKIIPILLFCLSTTITPGPNNIMLMDSGLNFGIKKSLPHYLGICLGFPAMVLLVAIGFGHLFEKYVLLKTILKVLGSIYMLYMAGLILSSLTHHENSGAIKPFNFIQAVLFQWVNPKAWLMAIGAISIFSLTTNPIENAFIISFIFFVVCLPCIGVWLLFGAGLQKVLASKEKQRKFNFLMAFCLVLSIILMMFD